MSIQQNIGFNVGHELYMHLQITGEEMVIVVTEHCRQSLVGVRQTVVERCRWDQALNGLEGMECSEGTIAGGGGGGKDGHWAVREREERLWFVWESE
jgi:hypothetical protein